jgi:hypothetical protein
LPGEIGLNALSGIGLALSALERFSRRVSTILLTQIGKYEELVSHLSEENRRRLSNFARDVARILTD